jgi:hypothetical protein
MHGNLRVAAAGGCPTEVTLANEDAQGVHGAGREGATATGLSDALAVRVTGN